jgi:hypothetical protein
LELQIRVSLGSLVEEVEGKVIRKGEFGDECLATNNLKAIATP